MCTSRWRLPPPPFALRSSTGSAPFSFSLFSLLSLGTLRAMHIPWRPSGSECKLVSSSEFALGVDEWESEGHASFPVCDPVNSFGTLWAQCWREEKLTSVCVERASSARVPQCECSVRVPQCEWALAEAFARFYFPFARFRSCTLFREVRVLIQVASRTAYYSYMLSG